MNIRKRVDRLEDAALGPETLWVGGLDGGDPDVFRSGSETRTRDELARTPGNHVLLSVVYTTPPPSEGVV